MIISIHRGFIVQGRSVHSTDKGLLCLESKGCSNHARGSYQRPEQCCPSTRSSLDQAQAYGSMAVSVGDVPSQPVSRTLESSKTEMSYRFLLLLGCGKERIRAEGSSSSHQLKQSL